LIQCNLKGKLSAYPCNWIQFRSFYLILLQSKKSYNKLPKIHSFIPYDAFNCSFVEPCVLPWQVHFIFANEKEKGNKNLIFIKKVKWFLHIVGWAQIAKLISHLFLNSALIYIILVIKLWFELHTILHWIIMPIKSYSMLGICQGELTP
jgi:uncharacterized membrane protein YukC